MRVTAPRPATIGLVLALTHLPLAGATVQESEVAKSPTEPSEKPAVELPMTVDELWHRTGGKKRSGYLIVSEDGLEFVARKKSFQIPIDRLQFVDFGTMRGDVDTDWVVLTVGVKAPYDLIGIRDGALWGFGKRTRTIHANLLLAMRELAAAQYSVSQGHRAFQTQDLKCSFEIPDEWHLLVESGGVGPSASAEVVFSARKIREVAQDETGRARSVDDHDLLDAVNAGEQAGFRVRQAVAVRGMSCDGFSNSVREQLTREFEARMSRDGLSLVGEVAEGRATVGDCDALHWVARGLDRQSRLVHVEAHALAKNGRMYFLSFRELDEALGARTAYENAVRTLRLGGALPE